MTGAREHTRHLAPITLPLNEVFGPTFQGEGPHSGRPCAFVRLGLCNLSCEWCDTPYTWDADRYDVRAENPDTLVSVIHDQLAATGAYLVVLSGGEPLLHHHKLPHLLTGDYEWHVETNGTIAPPSWWDNAVRHTTVSPKINTRSDPEGKRLKPAVLDKWAGLAELGRACFKFVANNPADLTVIDRVVREHLIPEDAVWVMPEGTGVHELIVRHRQLAPGILERGWNTTTRLHTLLWDNEKGH